MPLSISGTQQRILMKISIPSLALSSTPSSTHNLITMLIAHLCILQSPSLIKQAQSHRFSHAKLQPAAIHCLSTAVEMLSMGY